MATVYFGNANAIHHPGGKEEPLAGDRVTTHFTNDSDTHSERMRTITHEDGVWVRHSRSNPTWVECADDPELEQALAAHYGCLIGRPTNGKEDTA